MGNSHRFLTQGNTNPVTRARELYGAEMLPKASVKPQRALTDDEIARAMEHVGERFSVLLTLLAESGIRVGEALGLASSALREQRASMAEQGQNVDTGLVFVTRNGKPQSQRSPRLDGSARQDRRRRQPA